MSLETKDFRSLVKEFQVKIISETLYDTGGNASKAARLLQIPRPSLLHLMKMLGMGPAQSYAFNHDLEDKAGVEHYYRLRAVQLRTHGFHLENMFDFEMGVIAYFVRGSDKYVSLYLYKRFRGKKHYANLINPIQLPVITLKECKLAAYLEKHQIPFLEVF